MQTTRDRSYDEWLATLRDIHQRNDPRIDLADLVNDAADALATYHDAIDSPYELVDALSSFQDHYHAAVEEACNRLTGNDDPLTYIDNVAWAALYLWYFDRLWSAVYGTVPDHRLTDPDELT